MADWLKRFVQTAETVAEWSKDRSTKVGAVIFDPKTKAIVSVGFNGFPQGVDDNVDARHDKSNGAKYLWTEHAERNSLYLACRRGICTEGLGIALGWFPCADCARAIIQSGIVMLVGRRPDLTPGGRWVEHHTVALEMLQEAGVELVFLDDEPTTEGAELASHSA